MMTTNNFLEYNLELDLINDARVSQKIESLIDSNVGDLASIVVSPSFVESVGVAVGDCDISICAKLSKNTYFEVQMLECAMAMENGADEIEISLMSGEVVDGEIGKIKGEILLLKDEIELDAQLKVDICFNHIKTVDNVKSIIEAVCAGGADFVILNLSNYDEPRLDCALNEIKSQSLRTLKQIGVKYINVNDELMLFQKTENILGPAWMCSELLRVEKNS